MKKQVARVFLLGLFLFLKPSAGQQQKQIAEPEVTSYSQDPAKLEPIEKRLARLTPPAGFSINRFAELSNPRLIAVADTGTVYVTQREPGTPVRWARYR